MKKGFKILFWLLAAISLIAAVGFYVYRLFALPLASSPNDFGVFGDYIGGVIGAFTGFISIVFLYFTYQKQLDIFKEQQRQTEMRQFEENFFQLLDGFRFIRKELNSVNDAENVGKDCLEYVRGLLEKPIDAICAAENAFDTLNALTTRTKIDKVYQNVFIPQANQLGHYFRSLYHLLKYIDTHCPEDDNGGGGKKMYFDLVQSQMSVDELYITCINGISSYGRKNLHPILDKSSFLENLAIDDNVSIQKLVYFYYPNTKRKNITGKRKNIIVLAGPNGSGKNTLSKVIMATRMPVRVTSIQAMLIRRNLNPFDLVGQQAAIRETIQKLIDPDDIYVISLNFCQLHKDGTNERLPLSIYDGLNPIAVIMLDPNMENMIESIRRDDRIPIDETFAELYLENEDTCASDYADYMSVPFYRVQARDHQAVIHLIEKMTKQ